MPASPGTGVIAERVAKADFLTVDEKRAAVGYQPAEGGEGAGTLNLVAHQLPKGKA